MRRQLRALTAAALLLMPAALRAETYQIDASHSTAGFTIRHMMVSNVRGAFSKLSGTVEFDAGSPALSRVDITIETASIDTNNSKRDDHLRSADFFDVANHPAVTFKSTKVERTSETRHRVTGNLTMHGVTKEVVLDVDGPTPEFPAQGAFRRGASATTTILRQDFGLTYNRALEGGGILLSDEVRISIDVELVRRTQQPPRPAS